jgi:signal transduction histidine kinase
MGIDDDDLPRVGARFYRSSAASSTDSDGSGLGLALVRRIVAVHNGTLRVQSTLGEGSRFDLVLPAVSAPETDRDRDAVAVYESGSAL